MDIPLLYAGIKPDLLIHAFNWRYATKVFDKDLKIPEHRFALLLEILRLSPSSNGLQPWKFVVVKNKKIRKMLQKCSLNQTQLTDASHLIVLCSLKKLDADYVNNLIALEKKTHGDGHSSLEDSKAYTLSFIESKSKEELQQWMAEQVYIALGFLLSGCAMLHIDSCPIEAIDKEEFDKVLGLNKWGIETQVAVAIGYRSDNDLYTREKKVRWNIEDIVITV